MDARNLITSVHNPKVKALARLAKRRERDAEQLFVVEGVRPVERAFAAGVDFVELVVCPEFFAGLVGVDDLVAKIAGSGVRVSYLGKEAFARVAYRQHPEGILAVARQWETELNFLPVDTQSSWA